MTTNTESEQVSADDLRLVSRRNLLKLLYKIPLWMLLAWGVTKVFPMHRWVWYLVPTFVMISVSFALFTRYLARRIERAETQASDWPE